MFALARLLAACFVQNGSSSSAHARVQVGGKPAEHSTAPVLPSQQTLAMLLN